MEILLFGALPLVTGLVVGVVAGRFARIQLSPLLIAPGVAFLLVSGVLFVGDLVSRASGPNPATGLPAVLHSFAGVLMVAPGVLLFGSGPAVAGAAFSRWLASRPGRSA